MGSYLDKPRDVDQLGQEYIERLEKKKEAKEAFEHIMGNEAVKRALPDHTELNTRDHHIQTREEALTEEQLRKWQRAEDDRQRAAQNEIQESRERANDDDVTFYE